MLKPSTPSRTVRHGVGSNLLVSCNRVQRAIVYAISPVCVGVLNWSRSGEVKVGCDRLFYLEDCTQEEISFISAHPECDYLCVGTKNHGLYATKISNPVLDESTRLPLQMSGEVTHSGCFLSFGDTDIFTFSSSFKNRKGQSPHRLTLWDLNQNRLLWRGGSDPLRSMCSFADDQSFAACTVDKVSLFSVQKVDSPNSEEGGPKIVVLGRSCNTVAELDGVRYVECVSCPSDKETFVALTEAGYIVSIDRHSGAIVRWMNCKVDDVTGVAFLDDFVVLSGSLVRFFKKDSWEFSGKIRSIEKDSRSPSLYTASVPCGRDFYLLFSSRGEMGVFQCIPEGDTNKVQFKRRSMFLPVENGEAVDWCFPSSSPNSSSSEKGPLWGLSSPSALYVLDTFLGSKKKVEQNISCSAFLWEHNIFACSLRGSSELIAYYTRQEWAEWAKVLLRSPVVSMAATASSQLWCLHSDGYTISVLSGKWEEARGSSPSYVFLPLENLTHRGEPLTQLIAADDDSVYGIADRAVYHLANDCMFHTTDKVVSAAKLGADLLLCFKDSCVRYKTLTQETVLVSSLPGIRAISVHPKRPVVAVADQKEIVLYELMSDLKPRTVETLCFSLSAIRSISWADDENLLVLDTEGGLTEFYLDQVRFSQGRPPVRQAGQRLAPPERAPTRAERRIKRSVSANVPSHRDLELRFGELNDFYVAQKKAEEQVATTPRGAGRQRMKSFDEVRHTLPSQDMSQDSAVEVSAMTYVNEPSTLYRDALERKPHDPYTNLSTSTEILNHTRLLKESLQNFQLQLENELADDEPLEDCSIMEMSDLAALMANLSRSLERKCHTLREVNSSLK